MLVISSEVFRTYCVLSEEGQVGRNIAQNTLNICNKTLFVATDGLLEYTSSNDSVSSGWSIYPSLPASLKMPRGESNLAGMALIKEVTFVLLTSTKF
jgi:hypothetical protein